MEFLQTIFLLFTVVFLGFLSRKRKIFKKEDAAVFSSFVYNFAFPALLIATLSKLRFDSIELGIVLGSLLPVLFLVLLIVFIYKRGYISKDEMVISSITVAFGSNAFFGIAYFDSLYGKEGLEFAVVTASVLGIAGVVLTTSFLEYSKNGRIALFIFKGVLFSPPVAAVVIGVVLALFDLHIVFLDKASDLLGKTAGGVATFVLGMFIYDTFSFSLIKESLPYVLLRAVALPLSTFLVLLFIPVVSKDIYIYLIQQSGIPAAVSITIFAQRYGYFEHKTAGIVTISSLSSFFTLGVLYILSG